ncbi:MAG: Nif3-like dinuclear metal center hexameric protein [Desulfotignum sp.]|nr:Nif3-like dinuclear metal center hexameric protein [Desulfotignum sp.]MCF8112342.1 Nif3-like dinuclear metal center hexameric protein [Desulfotignum sp.]MCF8124620.1 Nif3-like dinuclear metal center hexameric protein [Desulfotignum sp.]
MTPSVKQILCILNEIAPGDLSESWDNCGLCAGNPEWAVKKILVGLDPGMQMMASARAWNADMVLTHHPLFITPEKTIDFQTMPGSAIAMAAREKIAIVCAHTNLDKVQNGLNDFFAERIHVVETRPLVPDTQASGPEAGRSGIGRIGKLTSQISVARVVHKIKKHLGLNQVRVVGNQDLMVRQVALCTGSGGSLIPDFLRSGADLYITGDIKYHEARLIETSGRALIDVGHFASEIIAVDLLSCRMGQAASRAGYELEIKGFDQEADPFTLV